jgi:hypothetical protein
MAAFQKGTESEVSGVRECFPGRIDTGSKGFQAVVQQQDQSLRAVSSGLQVTRLLVTWEPIIGSGEAQKAEVQARTRRGGGGRS